MPPVVFGNATIINIGGCCPRPMPMPMCGCSGPIFGAGFCRPRMPFWPISPAYVTGAMIGSTVGAVAGAAIACPEFGKALAWPFQQLWKGATWVWNKAIKPAASWAWNSVIKPVGKWIGNGIKKAWNWVTGLFKKKKKKSEKAE